MGLTYWETTWYIYGLRFLVVIGEEIIRTKENRKLLVIEELCALFGWDM